MNIEPIAIKGNTPPLSELHAAAREYVAAGIPVFPTISAEQGRYLPKGDRKKPATLHGFKDATTDLDQIDRWWAENPLYNLAMCPENSGWAVVDVELGGIEDWAKITGSHNAIATYSVRTASGGKHYYFEGSVQSRVKMLKPVAIDTRGRGGYVLVPPSRVYNDDDSLGLYEIDTDADIAPLPDWLSTLVSRHLAPVLSRPSGADPDDPGNVGRMASHLKGLVDQGDVAIEGQGGNYRTYCLATELIDHVRADTALKLMSELWNPHCLPPWNEEELQVLVSNALAYRQNAVGAKSVSAASDVFADIVSKLPVEGPANDKRSRFYPQSEAEMENQPPTEWLIQGLLQHGKTALLVGETQSYKSFLALDLALSVAAGVEFAGQKPLKTGPTFYAALEGLHDIKGARRKAWRIARQIEDTRELPFFAMDAPMVASAADCKEFMGQIAERCAGGPSPCLIVLETLNKIMGGLDENSSKDTGRLVMFVDELCARFKCAVLVIHHKSDKNGADIVRGSSALRAGFDTLLEADADRSVKTLKVRVHKHKDAPEPEHPFTFVAKTVAGSLVLQPAEAAEIRKRAMDADPYHSANVGAALKALGAIGIEARVSSHVLLSHMMPIGEGETVEKHMARLEKARRRLNDRAKNRLDAYADKFGKEWIWYLPET